VVRQFVDDWYKTQRITETDDKLVKEIADRMIDNYRMEFEDKDYPFEQYKKDMEADLQASSLKRVYIDMVLAQVVL
jgi:FKBP-type peptidyl-prolyl cis-trans isomerase (trigger factor)